VRTLLLVGIAVAMGVGSLKFLPTESEPFTLAECRRDFGPGLLSGLPTALQRHVPPVKLEAASRAVCPELMKPKNLRALVEDDSPRTYERLIREQPKLSMPICTLVVDADLAANARLYRFASAAERSRYRSEHCRLAARYLTVASTQGDLARLAADHPVVYAPICASLVQHGAGPAALASVTRKQLQRITRRACLEGLRNGAITCGPNGFADGKVDEVRFEAIVSRVSDEIEVS
jgi:hypothetical protein